MSKPTRGLYESLVTEALEEELRHLDQALGAKTARLRAEEAPDRFGLHLNRLVRRAIESLPEKQRVEAGLGIVRELLELLDGSAPDAGLVAESPSGVGEVLRSIAHRLPDGSVEEIEAPLIPLLDTTLLTNSRGEPHVGRQILAEIGSADRIDVVMAFIRRSGIARMMAALRRHREEGRGLRVLTTTYTNSTELAALEQLAGIGAEVQVSYETRSTRLHAKAWLFHRSSGFSTAYIGSSNLTHSAQVTGLEWNVRVSGARNPDVIDKVGAVFESYWNSDEFEEFDAEVFRDRTKPQEDRSRLFLGPELRPEPFQERLLEQVALARQLGHHRNLLVSATGTGKTVMAAVDYLRLTTQLDRSRLLFVAHRAEILDQSLATFRYARRDHSFGELWVRGERPRRFEHVFASIQSLSAADLDALEPDHFDVVIVDEFHHAAAPTYRKLLEHVRPKELLGLTATPERADGLSVLEHFGGRIAAELRLWDAIDRQRLCPFLYYGIADGTDLRAVPWRRGRGYDVEGLTNVLTADDARARQVLGQLADRVGDLQGIRCLGFCVSVEHAKFMARIFREEGVRAAAISGASSLSERESALRELARGELQVLFSVDLFNEGVDVPSVDTILFLRPTDSGTLFLQQLGRGLRPSEGKSVCTVLDFVGQHRKEFRFDRRFRALLGGSRKDLQRQIEGGFPFLPAGCHMELDAVASKRVLDNIKAAVPSTWNAKVEELRAIAASAPAGDVALAEFLAESDLELEDVYSGNRGWSDLRRAASLATTPEGPDEATLLRACGRLLHVDDAVRIDAYRALLEGGEAPAPDAVSGHELRLLRMLVASISRGALKKGTSLADGARHLWGHPQVRAELLELMDVLRARVDHVHTPLSTHPDSPLQVHARYTRVEILGALGVGEGAVIQPFQQGVRWLPDIATDVFVFTLDKSSGGFSPTTRYRDYAISRDLIHWESQNSVREANPTGRRYREHARRGTHVLLFARERTDSPFWFLGPATYVRHESELPMRVTWRLEHSLPGDLFAAFAAAVA